MCDLELFSKIQSQLATITKLRRTGSVLLLIIHIFYFLHKAIHKIICMVNKKMFYCLAKMTREEDQKYIFNFVWPSVS